MPEEEPITDPEKKEEGAEGTDVSEGEGGMSMPSVGGEEGGAVPGGTPEEEEPEPQE
ncbi:MAG: hypothetical protein GTN40_05190 [Candidatus Aenigmarchaeota archaeon]|nr:hypothetical protein [Candidatus Aenigmarchaeota archaeon]